MDQIIDAKGWQCPKPIIETKKLLDTMKQGSVTTIVDNQIAVDNLKSFAQSLNYSFSFTREDSFSHVKIEKPLSEVDSSSPTENHDRGLVIQISSNRYGTGEEELGENLMKAYIYALTEVETKPSVLMFVNSGVLLTVESSPVLDSLTQLEEEGVEILSCGACLNFYQLSDKLKIGSITNMYTMAEKLNHAKNAVKI